MRSDGSVVSTLVSEGELVEREQVEVDGWKDIVAVSAGGLHTVGLKSDGTVVAVGNDENGQLNVNEWEDIIAVSAGTYNTVGLKSDGTVVATKITIMDLSDFPDVDPDDFDEDRGQSTVEDWEDIVMISAGQYHTVGLKSDGTVVATAITNEDADFGQTAVDDWKDIVAVSAGGLHTVGLKSDGTVVAVGNDDNWETAVDDWKDIVAVSAGEEHTLGLKSDGTVVGVGGDPVYLEDWPQLGNWKDIIAVSAGYNVSIGLKSDGTVVAEGLSEDTFNVDGWKDIVNYR